MEPEIENSNLSPPDAAVTAGDDDNFDFGGDDDFEFPFVARDNESGADGITADGRVRLVYPLFDRDLLRGGGGDAAAIDFEVEEREVYPRSGSVSSTSSGDDVEEARSVPASPGWCKKSRSTGSASSRRWRLRDLVIGRSHSDGKDKFVFLAPAAGKKKSVTSTSEALPAATGSKGKVTETDMATAHRLYYSKGGAAAGGGGAGRRSFLPYKQDLVGFLGLSRTHRF